MKLICPVLLSTKYISARHAQREVSGGQNISLPLLWSDVPAESASFVLVMTDLFPECKGRTHWYVTEIPASAREIVENASGFRDAMPRGCLELRNDFGLLGYSGPVASKGKDLHEYEIALHALRIPHLGLGPFATSADRAAAMKEAVIASANVRAMF